MTTEQAAAGIVEWLARAAEHVEALAPFARLRVDTFDGVVLATYLTLLVMACRGIVVGGRRSAERALTGDELHLKATALENVTCGIVVTDPHQADNPIIYCNPAFRQITGYSESEVLGSNARLLQGPDTAGDAVGRIRTAIVMGRGCREIILNYRKDGSSFWNELTIAPVTDEDGNRTHFVGIQTDITARKEAEDEKAILGAELGRAGKMESLGVLAGGIAHDFNNLLGVIMGNTELAMNKTAGNDKLARNLERTLEASNHAKQLVGQMLSFSRQDTVEMTEVEIQPVVEEAVTLLRSSLPATVRMRLSIDKPVGSVIANANQIHRVIINLCTNAHHAMGGGDGELGISLETVTVDEEQQKKTPNVKVGEYVRLSVSDTGCGMDEDTMAKIFDPFFTTKPVDKGTGMGLSVVYGMISKHRGAITVDSTLGKGTTFHVYLPLSTGSTDERACEPELLSTLRGWKKRVIVIDDEQSLLDMAEETLTSLGYQVTALANSTEALDLLRDQPEAFDIAVIDQDMAHFSGMELAKLVANIRPDLPVIAGTDYGDTITPDHVRMDGVTGYVRKPYLAAELDTAIRSALRRTSLLEV